LYCHCESPALGGKDAISSYCFVIHWSRNLKKAKEDAKEIR
jgi:hypothetical protein